MQVTTALLCDFAQVRANMLFVLSGGITRLNRPAWPASMQCSLALMIEMHPTESARPHELEVIIQGQDGERIGEVAGAFQLDVETQPLDLDVGESLHLPVALNLAGIGVPKPGPYSIELLIDGAHVRTLHFRASQMEPDS